MQLPEQFKENLIRIFGENAEKWISDFPVILQKCIEKWQLKNLVFIEPLSINFVCFAESKLFGKSVLKIGVPNPELYSEITALKLFNRKNSCRIYDSDLDLGALLLERIIPGTDLTNIKESDDRFFIASEVITCLPEPIKENLDLPSYSDWVSRAFGQAKGDDYKKILPLVNKANDFFLNLEDNYTQRMVLHGDLHHKNILNDNHGWKAIDPKGVIGLPYLESARFIKNQLEMVNESERLDNLEKMVKIFSEKMNINPKIISKCAFIDSVLSTCWSIEENDSPENIDDSIKSCQLILDYLNSN